MITGSKYIKICIALDIKYCTRMYLGRIPLKFFLKHNFDMTFYIMAFYKDYGGNKAVRRLSQ